MSFLQISLSWTDSNCHNMIIVNISSKNIWTWNKLPMLILLLVQIYYSKMNKMFYMFEMCWNKLVTLKLLVSFNIFLVLASCEIAENHSVDVFHIFNKCILVAWYLFQDGNFFLRYVWSTTCSFSNQYCKLNLLFLVIGVIFNIASNW